MLDYIVMQMRKTNCEKGYSEFNRQPVQIIQQRSYMTIFGFLENYPSSSILDPLQLIKLVGWQAIEQAVTIIDAT